MRTITQRELRNDNAEIMREVERGESFEVTRRGVRVALVVPTASAGGLRCVRPARARPDYRTFERVTLTTSSAEVLDDLRGER